MSLVVRQLIHVFGYDADVNCKVAILDDDHYCHAVSNALVVESTAPGECGPHSQSIFNLDRVIRRIIGPRGESSLILIQLEENEESLKSVSFISNDSVLMLNWRTEQLTTFDLTGFDLPIVDVAMDAYGTGAAVLDSNGMVGLWNLNNHNVVKIKTVETSTRREVDEIPHGVSLFCMSTFATFGNRGLLKLSLKVSDKNFRILNVNSSKKLEITVAVWSNVNLLIYGSRDGTLLSIYPPVFESKIIDRHSGLEVTALSCHETGVFALFGTSIVSFYSYSENDKHQPYLNHVYSKDFLIDKSWMCNVEIMQVAPSGNILMIGFSNGKLYKFDTATIQTNFALLHSTTVNVKNVHPKNLAVSSNSQFLVFLSKRTLKCTVHDLNTKAIVNQLLISPVNFCAFSPRLDLLAVSAYEHSLYMYAFYQDGGYREYGRINFKSRQSVHRSYPLAFSKVGDMLAVWLGDSIEIVDVITLESLYRSKVENDIGDLLQLEWSQTGGSEVYGLHSKSNILSCWSVLERCRSSTYVLAEDGYITSNLCATPTQDNILFGTSNKQMLRIAYAPPNLFHYFNVMRCDAVIKAIEYFEHYNYLIVGLDDGKIRILRYNRADQKSSNVWFNLDCAAGPIDRMYCGQSNHILAVTCKDGPLRVYRMTNDLQVMNMNRLADQHFCDIKLINQKQYIHEFYDKQTDKVHNDMQISDIELMRLQGSIDIFASESIKKHCGQLKAIVDGMCRSKDIVDNKCSITGDERLSELRKVTKQVNRCLKGSLSEIRANKIASRESVKTPKTSKQSKDGKQLTKNENIKNKKGIRDMPRERVDSKKIEIIDLQNKTKEKISQMLRLCLQDEYEMLKQLELQMVNIIKAKDRYKMGKQIAERRLKALMPEIIHYEQIEDDIKQELTDVPKHTLLSAPEMVNTTFMQMTEKIVMDNISDEKHSQLVEKRQSYLRFAYHLQEAMLSFGMNDLEMLIRKYKSREAEITMVEREILAKNKHSGGRQGTSEHERPQMLVLNLERQLRSHHNALKVERDYVNALRGDIVALLRNCRPSILDITAVHNRRVTEMNKKFMDHTSYKNVKSAMFHYNMLLKRRNQILKNIFNEGKHLRQEARIARFIANKHKQRMMLAKEALDRSNYYAPKVRGMRYSKRQFDLVHELEYMNGVERKREQLKQIRNSIANMLRTYLSMDLQENELLVFDSSLHEILRAMYEDATKGTSGYTPFVNVLANADHDNSSSPNEFENHVSSQEMDNLTSNLNNVGIDLQSYDVHQRSSDLEIQQISQYASEHEDNRGLLNTGSLNSRNLGRQFIKHLIQNHADIDQKRVTQKTSRTEQQNVSCPDDVEDIQNLERRLKRYVNFKADPIRPYWEEDFLRRHENISVKRKHASRGLWKKGQRRISR